MSAASALAGILGSRRFYNPAGALVAYQERARRLEAERARVPAHDVKAALRQGAWFAEAERLSAGSLSLRMAAYNCFLGGVGLTVVAATLLALPQSTAMLDGPSVARAVLVGTAASPWLACLGFHARANSLDASFERRFAAWSV